MSPKEDTLPFNIENTRVFDYSQEVIVELHGQTPDGEFEAVSYTFRVDPDVKRELQPPEIDAAHQEAVWETLAETDYVEADPSQNR
jgi:hypothetical protein